ncbi:MAG: type II secretion system protein [Tepidisphaeraceae bacterium]
MRIPRHQHGFTLLEMVIVLAVLAVIGLVAARLTGMTLSTMSSSAGASAQTAALDAVTRSLRLDAWSARGVSQPQPERIELDTPAGPVTYTIDPQRITRFGPAGGASVPVRSTWPIGSDLAHVKVADDASAIELNAGKLQLRLDGPMLASRKGDAR